MDGYPLNLILATAVASATIFLGFLPTKSIQSSFFGGEVLKAGFAWLFIAFGVPAGIMHYYILGAVFCAGSWWKFRADNSLSGKMWLSIVSGLGISVGVMLILAVTPRANPPGLPQLNAGLLLASIYLGGIVIGLAYVCYTLAVNISAKTGITNALVQRYVGVLFLLILARALVLLLSAHFNWNLMQNAESPGGTYSVMDQNGNSHLQSISVPIFHTLLLVAGIMVLPILGFLARRATRLSSRILPTRYLVAILFLAFLTEAIARLLIL